MNDLGCAVVIYFTIVLAIEFTRWASKAIDRLIKSNKTSRINNGE